MRRSSFALRLQPLLLEELRKAAELEGVALNQLINVAVAEKVSALRTEEYFRERGAEQIAPKPCGFLQRQERAIPRPQQGPHREPCCLDSCACSGPVDTSLVSDPPDLFV